MSEDTYLLEGHAQHDGRWCSMWIGYSFRRFLLGLMVSSDDRGASLGFGFLYVGVGLYDKSGGGDDG